MGCTFCATGTMGLKGDLTAGEIVEQLWHARGVTSIRNVVFMVRQAVCPPEVQLGHHEAFLRPRVHASCHL